VTAASGPSAIVILSAKCSGSTALHRALERSPAIRAAAWTTHEELETLYWTKAASVLGRPQDPMVESTVPYPRDVALASLDEFLVHNGATGLGPAPDETELIDRWIELRRLHEPCFLEKSPHHLRQVAALELLAEAIRRDDGCRYLVVAIIRNPLDVVYSAWRRFRYRPEQYQWEWAATYEQLEVAGRLYGDRFVALRYEDVVTGATDVFERVADLVGVPASTWDDRGGLHGGSLRRWSTDPAFGFSLHPDVVRSALALGYEADDLRNPQASRTWPLRREALRIRRRLRDARS
jgi:hypothetical protein